MSKQTNRFQRLVFALNELLGPDAKVEESRELVDSVTGAKREVDVCIETESNGHKLIVGIGVATTATSRACRGSNRRWRSTCSFR